MNKPYQFLRNRLSRNGKQVRVPHQVEPALGSESANAPSHYPTIVVNNETRGDARHGEYTVSDRHITGISELQDLGMVSSINVQSIRDELKHYICPIQIRPVGGDEGRMFAIVMTREMLGNDAVDQIHAELSKSYKAARPEIYVAAQAVVSELARLAGTATANAVRMSAADRESPYYKMFIEIVDFAVENGTSDIHIKWREEEEYSQVSFRMDGKVIRPRKFRMASSQVERMLGFWYSFRGNSTSTSSYSTREVLQCQIEETINGKRLGFRWSQFGTHKGLKVVLRMMHLDARDTFTSLGMEENGAGLPPYQANAIERALLSDGGGWLLSGKVNSGKSKLLQTIISLLPPHFEINTAEDPIEYVNQHEGSNQHSTSRAPGSKEDDDSFAPFRMANKRTDPDVTSISELRDTATTAAFRDAVLAGQLSFTTIHAPDALAIPQRLLSEEFGLSRDLVTMPGFLKVLLHLALVPKSCPHCALLANDRETSVSLNSALEHPDSRIADIARDSLRVITPETLKRIERLFQFDTSKMKVRNPHGCPKCRRADVPELNGLRGRSLVAQLIEPDTEMLLLLRDSKNIELQQYYRSLRTAGFDSDNSMGKNPLEVAMFKISQGHICLSMAESRFQSLDAYEHELKRLHAAQRPTTLGYLNSRRAVRRPVNFRNWMKK